MPRIGVDRSLKWALEGFWADRLSETKLEEAAYSIRKSNWETMESAGIDFIPSNDFSLYDHVLDTAVMVGAIPSRFRSNLDEFDLKHYFELARGATISGHSTRPLILTKWFDTNYHHLVPELGPSTIFRTNSKKACAEIDEALTLGILTTPVLLGPLTFLLRSSPVEADFDVLTLLDPLVDIYRELLGTLADHGALWVRFDEPALVEDRSDSELLALRNAYRRLAETGNRPRIALTTYFGHVGSAMSTLADLPIEGIGLDFCQGRENLALLENLGGLGNKVLFAGIVNGRNVWRNDLDRSLTLVDRLDGLAKEVVVSTSCSLIHVPLSLKAETNLNSDIRPWFSFAEEKLAELAILARGIDRGRTSIAKELASCTEAFEARRRSLQVEIPGVRSRASSVPADPRRSATASERSDKQKARFQFPLLPTTTIGSFPQTQELRTGRNSLRNGLIDSAQYGQVLKHEIDRVIEVQEKIGLDVLVHGEPERDDMVRYFAGMLDGFELPESGWVQSYGSRCVRPPVLFGDVSRSGPMTIKWIRYAQSRTKRPVKGMLTGPVTMLRWSFVRDDQAESDTAIQLALAINDELSDLQSAGITVIQVDEPALREGLPLRNADRQSYLEWATRAFRLAVSAAEANTQVHTHMCYAQLEDIVEALDNLEIDVISLEAARSQMNLLDDLEYAHYSGGVGPGVYDVHAPIVPETDAIKSLLRRAIEVVGSNRLWVNPDCGLKTRSYEEIVRALGNMVDAAKMLREELFSD